MLDNAPTANVAWRDLLHRILTQGEIVQPRGKVTREVLGFSTSFAMSYPVVTLAQRKLGYRFLLAEAAWILSGDNRVETIAPYARDIVQFSDDGILFFGAYGPRIRSQLPHVLKSLVKDRDTRQAVLTIWRESPPDTRDVPCSVSVQWFIRNNRLHCIFTMRSSDAWLGAPYDWFNFTMLSVYVARLYTEKTGQELELGNLHFFAGSSHLYEPQWAETQAIVDERPEDRQVVFECPRLQPWGLGISHTDVVPTLWQLANRSFVGLPESTFLRAELESLRRDGRGQA